MKANIRPWIEWGLMIAFIVVVYATGSQAEVFGFVQRMLLKTGIMNPDISEEVIGFADYNWKLQDENGNVFNVDSFKGKTIFMNHWATWCPPCVAEMPSIEKLYNQTKAEIVFLMISHDDEFGKAIQFKKKKGFSFPLYQHITQIPEVFQSQSIPTTFVVDPSGNIVYKKSGMASYDNDEFIKFLKELK